MTEPNGRHGLILENRSRLELTGVTDVDRFSEEGILLYTQLGELSIKGRNLHINRMNVESGELSVEGDIAALVYGDKERTGKLSLIGRIFR